MDVTDYKILSQIQKKADIPLVDLANLIGLSKTACWNRLRRLEEDGVIIGKFVQLNRFSLNLPIVVFLAITVRRHSKEWVKQFQEQVKKVLRSGKDGWENCLNLRKVISFSS